MIYVEGLITYVDRENGFFYLRINKDTEIKVRCKDCNFTEGEKEKFLLRVKKYRNQLLFFLEEPIHAE
jgi:transketolase C-terminal domain/subunit